jgi:hypothetical protein
LVNFTWKSFGIFTTFTLYNGVTTVWRLNKKENVHFQKLPLIETKRLSRTKTPEAAFWKQFSTSPFPIYSSSSNRIPSWIKEYAIHLISSNKTKPFALANINTRSSIRSSKFFTMKKSISRFTDVVYILLIRKDEIVSSERRIWSSFNYSRYEQSAILRTLKGHKDGVMVRACTWQFYRFSADLMINCKGLISLLENLR